MEVYLLVLTARLGQLRGMDIFAVLLDVARTIGMVVMLLLLALVMPLLGLLFGAFVCLVLTFAVLRGGSELFLEWRRARAFTRPAERDRA